MYFLFNLTGHVASLIFCVPSSSTKTKLQTQRALRQKPLWEKKLKVKNNKKKESAAKRQR